MSTATEEPALSINPLQIQSDTLAKLKPPYENGARAAFRGEDAATANPFDYHQERSTWSAWGQGYDDAMRFKRLATWMTEEAQGIVPAKELLK